MKSTIITVLIIPTIVVAGYFAFDSYSYRDRLVDLSMYDQGSYPYRCDNGTEFTMSPSADMTSILVRPVSPVDRVGHTVLALSETESGVRYEGGGLVFAGKGETAMLSGTDFSATCLPVPSDDGAPFNFGD